jgi:tRNA threonylcarbamoyladenosine modification (KEOPS) complex  Pcc1 subunit
MVQQFQWMVFHGRVGMRRDGSNVVLDVDPESSTACRLNCEDSLGMIDVLTKIGQEIWQSSPTPQNNPGNQFRVDENSAYIWDTSAGRLQLNLDGNNDFIEIKTDDRVDCVLDIKKLSEFIQILQHLNGQLTGIAE